MTFRRWETVAGSSAQRRSPRGDRLQAAAARGELGLVIADVGPQERVLLGHGARLADEFDKLIDAKRLLVSGARAAGGRETIRRLGGLGRLGRGQGLGG